MSSEKQRRCAFAYASVLLHVEDARTPCAYLCADVEELRRHGQPQVRATEQFREAAAVAAVLVFAVNGREVGPPDHQRQQ